MRIHLSTALATTIVAGLVIGLNALPYERDRMTSWPVFYEYGWPHPFYIAETWSDHIATRFEFGVLVNDVAHGAVLVFAFAIPWEISLRFRLLSRLDMVGIVSLTALLLTATFRICNFVFPEGWQAIGANYGIPFTNYTSHHVPPRYYHDGVIGNLLFWFAISALVWVAGAWVWRRRQTKKPVAESQQSC